MNAAPSPPWTFTHAPTFERGQWVLRHYGHDVGMVSLLPEVGYQAVRLEAIVATLNATDAALSDAASRHPSASPE